MPKRGHVQGKKKGQFRDPLNKWREGPGEVAHDINDPVVAASLEVNKLARAASDPGIRAKDRALLNKALSDARATLRNAQLAANEMKREVNESQKIQSELISRLTGIRAYMENTDQTLLGPMHEKLTALESRMNSLLVTNANLNAHAASTEDLAKVKEEMEKVKKEVEDLPEKVKDPIEKKTKQQRDEEKRQKEIEKEMAALRAAQEAAAEHIKEVREGVRSVARNVGSWAARKAMGAADRIGVGPLSVGNALRAAGAVGRGARGAYRGTKYAIKTAQAIRLALGAKAMENASEGKTEEELLTTFKDHVEASKRFQRRLLKDKPKVSDSASMIKSLLGSLLPGGIEALLKKFGFGALASGAAAVAGAGARGAVSLLSNPAAVIAAGGAAASIFSTAVAKSPLAQQTFVPKKGQDPGDPSLMMLNAMSGDLGLGANIMGNGSGTDSFFSAQTWIDSGKKIRDLFSGKGGNPWSSGTTDTSKMPIVQQFNSVKAAASDIANTVTTGASNLVNSGSALVSDWLGKTFSAGGNVDVKGLNPTMQANMTGMAQEYYQMTGKKLPLNSANRSMEAQAALYSSMPPGRAAAPGRSLHNYGLAFDTNSPVADELDRLGLLKKYGFERPIKGEKWHVQPMGLTISAAKAGLYSADAPADQNLGRGAKATPVPQRITPPTPTGASASASAPGGAQVSAGKPAISATGRNGVRDIPTFDSSDGLFLALNMGAAM